VDKRTGEAIRRYEHDKPGAMIHVDVKKLGNIPDGGGWRYVGRQQGGRNRAGTRDKARSRHRDPLIGTSYVEISFVAGPLQMVLQLLLGVPSALADGAHLLRGR
jgi:hypothetical protein